MLNKDNIIDFLFQIGFYEEEEYEIVFSSFEEKLQYRKGQKRFLKIDNGRIIIDFNTREILFWGSYKHTYLRCLSLDDINNLFIALNDEYKHDIRKMKIKKLLK